MRDHQGESKPQPFRLSNLTGDASKPVWQIVNIWQASEALRELVHHPLAVSVADHAARSRYII